MGPWQDGFAFAAIFDEHWALTHGVLGALNSTDLSRIAPGPRTFFTQIRDIAIPNASVATSTLPLSILTARQAAIAAFPVAYTIPPPSHISPVPTTLAVTNLADDDVSDDDTAVAMIA